MDRPLLAADYSNLLTPATGFASEAGRSFLHTWQSMAQSAVDLFDRNGYLPKLQLIDAPKPASFATSDWAAQHLGSAAAIAVPFYFMHKGVSYSTDKMFGKLAEQSLRREVAMATTTGFLFGTLLSPVDQNDPRNYYEARLENGVTLGLSVGAMTYSALKIQSLGKSLSPTSPVLGGLLKTDLLAGALSGIPGGLVYAETNALANRRLYPTLREAGDSVTNFSMVGGLLGLPGTLAGKPLLTNPFVPAKAP